MIPESMLIYDIPLYTFSLVPLSCAVHILDCFFYDGAKVGVFSSLINFYKHYAQNESGDS